MTKITKVCNLLLLGSTGVGKTSFLRKINDVGGGDFTKKYSPTNKIEKGVVCVKTHDGEIQFNITEVAGQQSFGRFDETQFYDGVDCLLVIFDFTQMISFELVDVYCNNVYKHLGKKIPTVVCGNKNDVSLRPGRRNLFTKSNFFDVSVKENDRQRLIAPLLRLAEEL